MLLLVALGCVAPALRPAHSLARGEGSLSLSVLADASTVRRIECTWPQAGEACPDARIPLIDQEYRLGLGRGWELAEHGGFLPNTLSVKYSFVDERRMATLVSVAVEAGVGLRLGTLRATELLPAARVDALASGTVRLTPRVQLRPAGSIGWGAEPRDDAPRANGPACTLGLFVPVRIPGGFAVSPFLMGSGWIPLGRTPEVFARFGVGIEPWLNPVATAIPSPG